MAKIQIKCSEDCTKGDTAIVIDGVDITHSGLTSVDVSMVAGALTRTRLSFDFREHDIDINSGIRIDRLVLPPELEEKIREAIERRVRPKAEELLLECVSVLEGHQCVQCGISSENCFPCDLTTCLDRVKYFLKDL